MPDKQTGVRGRPRTFDVEQALATGQQMFHAHGFEGVSLSMLTDRLGIAPPSFYSAFGSKAAFFERVLDRYLQSTFSLEDILREDRDAGDAITDLLRVAAKTYSADARALGCLALEATRACRDDRGGDAARAVAERSRSFVRDFVGRRHPAVAERASDFVAATMHGLSACARDGWDAARLEGVADAAGAAVVLMCQDPNDRR